MYYSQVTKNKHEKGKLRIFPHLEKDGGGVAPYFIFVKFLY